MLLLGREIVETRDLVHAEIDLVAQRGQSRAVEVRPPGQGWGSGQGWG
tara:strand:- start:785 stop:928 length:144 start_codon:yes stop_codon:yes gene_type:complete